MALLDLHEEILDTIVAYISVRDRVALLSACRKYCQSFEPTHYWQDAHGEKPCALLWASENGKVHTTMKAVAAIKGAPIPRGIDGRRPLSMAAKAGHESLLLEAERADPNERDDHGQTPLSLSSFMGHEGVVKLLLSANGINPDPTNNYGRSALSLAAEAGRLAVGVDVDSKDDDGQTPFWFAIGKGHEGVVNLLTGTARVDAGVKDNEGDTPLSWAAWKGNQAMVKLLLATEGVNPSSKNKAGQTALSLAAMRGNEALLLATEGVDPDSKDNFGSTPLIFAIKGGHEAVCGHNIPTCGWPALTSKLSNPFLNANHWRKYQ
ncbi:LOW QUALITY PROTEIN: ankyrin repeat-containing domain protein [Microdochium trichocladiopsis]|uniref:Ankyrin repeat-containing domain protein n=1 Tax=Microdochium trichocladiopsis TaxID=1682393 RepID=A0A9P8Y9V9_9PEZI|nr:LOW QUALITY PROTEIN: ankyrin repeat-containing domain protein [Microdochium trichocladiopsis]KAH7034491.1 LOW QUALITY PROTEIN: ankyrin repeat-containing domain protein [Microdochium trichocladiopsis]